MKKSFALFIVLLVFAIGGTCYVNASLLQEKDNVKITETVVYGDKSVVEGVTVERNIKFSNYIRWNTTYVVGEESGCETVYTFDEGGGLREENTYTPEGITLHTDPVGGFDGTEDTADKLTGVDRAMWELFQETEPGQEKSRIINLADYLDYYEYEMMIDLPGDIHHYWINKEDIANDMIRYSSNESYTEELVVQLHMLETMTEFFKIPVIENHFYEISVAKDTEGNLYGWGYGSANGGGSSGNVTMGNTLENADSFSLWMISAYTEDACYFTFDPYTYEGQLVDTGHIPGGYGIYCLPFNKEERTIDVDNLRMVYALEPTDRIYALRYDERRNQLLLFQEKETGSTMTVIDENTMEKKQEIVYTEGGYGAGFYQDEDFILLDFADNLMVLSVKEDGIYQEELTCDLNYLIGELGLGYLDFEYMDFDWNGERFIMSGSLNDTEVYRHYQGCGFYLAAFDETGLIYYGEYKSSLDAESSYSNSYYDSFYSYDYTCRPTEIDPIKISW